MENDEHLMEHTEKIVADMLKFVLAPNETHTDDSLEFVFYDDAGTKFIQSTTDIPTYIFNTSDVKVSMPSAMAMKEIDIFLAQGLEKIRNEYPMYPEHTIPFCHNCYPSVMHQPNYYGIPSNTLASMNDNIWLSGENAALGNNFVDAQQNNLRPQNNNNLDDLLNEENKWRFSSYAVPTLCHNKNGENVTTKNDTEDNLEADDEEVGSNNDSSSTTTFKAQQSQNIEEATPSNTGDVKTESLPSVAPTTTNEFQLSQTALHQTHTTTTATAFGLVHQQTSSSTTTNFVSNNLANATLATTNPNTLYAQALLAQQYMTVILRQRQNINMAHQPTTMQNNNNINAAIYERFAYAQLLQQQILQQQQQQAAMAALLQQQKVAIQNNIAAAAMQAANNNVFVQQSSNVFEGGHPSAPKTNGNLPTNGCSVGGGCPINASSATINVNMQLNSDLANDTAKVEAFTYKGNHKRIEIDTNLSINSLPLHVTTDHDGERAVACQGISSKVLQTLHD